MKLLRKVVAAQTVTEIVRGNTSFYRVELEDAIKALQKNKANIWLIHRLEADGWAAINLEHNLFGSLVVDDILYICSTDGEDIDVKGESIDPEQALAAFGPDPLSEYIQDGTPEVISRFISEFDLADFDIDETAEDMLKEGKSFIDMMADAQTLPQLS